MHKLHFGLTKKIQFLADQMDYWLKVPNILVYRFSLTKCKFSIGLRHLCQEHDQKVPHNLQGSKNMTSKE